MSLVPTTTIMNDSTRNIPKWDMFKGLVKNGFGHFTSAVKMGAGYSPSDTPLRDAAEKFIDNWIKPAAHDAKETVDNWLGKADDFISQAEEYVSENYPEASEKIQDILNPAGSPSTGPTYSSVRPSQNSGATIDYLNADLAKHYGMDAQAAYSEALQNTAYQRAVADLKRAGLNPVLAAGSVSPAGSYAAGNTLSGGSGSGSSGGYRSGNSGKYAFSSDAYNLIGLAGTVIGAIGGLKASPKSPVLGMSTGMMIGKQLAQSAAQALSSTQNLI